MDIATLEQLADFCAKNADTANTTWTTEGYKNAPDTIPQIGDIVEWGSWGDTVVVASIGPPPHPDAQMKIINCSVDGALHLNKPSDATLVKRP